MMEVHTTSPGPSQQVPPHQHHHQNSNHHHHQIGSFGPVRRRSKRRTSPVGLEDRPLRRPRAGSDHSLPSTPTQNRPRIGGQFDHRTAFSPTGGPAPALQSPSVTAAVDPAPRVLSSLDRERLVPIGGTGTGSQRLGVGGLASPSSGHPPSPFYQLANLQGLRAGYDPGHDGQHQAAYSFAPGQTPPQLQNVIHHAQQVHASSSYHQDLQWYGNSVPQQDQQVPPASNQYGSSGRSSGNSPRRLPLRPSPPPFPAPLLQAEVSHLATAPDQTSPLSPPAPRDLSRLLHHRSQPKSHDSVSAPRQPPFNAVPPNALHLGRYSLHQPSPPFDGPANPSNPTQSGAQPTVSSLAVGSATGMGAGLVDFAASPAHPPVAEAQASSETTSSDNLFYGQYSSSSALASQSGPLNVASLASLPSQSHFHQQRRPTAQSGGEYQNPAKRIDTSIIALINPPPYGQVFLEHPRRRSLSSPNSTPLPAVTRTQSTYTHPACSVAGSGETYALPPAHPQTGAHQQHSGYPGHASMAGDSDSWLLLPPGPPSSDDQSHSQHLSDQQVYHQHSIAENAVIPLLASNGIGEQWEDASVELSRQEMEMASQHAHGRPPQPIRGGKADIKKTRGKFTEEKRRITAQTRKSGACIRCKCQRVRCEPSDINDPSAPCASCLKVNQQSKKMIHACICRRYKLQDMVLSRQGGLNLTNRWNGTQMRDVGDRVDDVVRIVEIKIFYSHDPRRPDLYHLPIKLEVYKFQPKEGDVLHRKWTTKDNVGMVTPLTAFALNNINAAATEIDRFVCDNAFDAIYVAVQDSEPIVRDTYHMAINHFRQLPDDAEERPFLVHLFKLWFAMRLTTGSAYISGSDKLDMTPDLRPDYPLGDKISLPRMITAQVDSILATKFLKHGATKVAKYLENYLRSNNPKYWFTLYLANFILLHEISVATKDRGRYARENQLPTRFSLPSVVREQHFSANNLLAHWHYYKTETDPSNVEESKLHKTPMSCLTEVQKRFVWQWWRWMRQPGMLEHLVPDDQREQEARWEHPLYFVAQMYMPAWKEKATFQG